MRVNPPTGDLQLKVTVDWTWLTEQTRPVGGATIPVANRPVVLSAPTHPAAVEAGIGSMQATTARRAQAVTAGSRRAPRPVMISSVVRCVGHPRHRETTAGRGPVYAA